SEPATRSGKIRTFKPKELARRVKLVRQLPGTDELLKGKVSILQKSGETNLTLDIGRLRFVDTINFCPSGLGKLIDSHRKSSECLDAAFPITAERHPYLRGIEDGKSATWSALMRKLPMPWDHFRDPADLRKPPVWDLECYHSRLSGPCSPKQHEELKATSELMKFGSFQEILDCYLALDITAYADLMQIFRTSFMEKCHLDVFQYPSLPSASWHAALRGGASFDLILDRELYNDVRRAMMGGLCAVFQPRSQANSPDLEYDPYQPTKQIMYLDINSIYPDAMTTPLPVSSGERVALPEDDDEKLQWLHNLLNHEPPEQCHLVFVTYDFPEAFHDVLDFAPPARLKIREGDVGPYTKPAVEGRPPSEKLVPYLGMHEMEGIHSKRLAFLRNHLGARIWKIHRAYVFSCEPRLASFMRDAYERRRTLKELGRDVEQGFVKLCLNSVYGKTVQNQEKYRNSSHYFNAEAFSKAQTDRRVADFRVEIMEKDAFLGTVLRVRDARHNVNRSPIQVGWGVLELSKLALAKQYWLVLKPTLPRIVPIFTDTDSVCMEILGPCSPVKLLAEANLAIPDAALDLIGDMDPTVFEQIYGSEISVAAMARLMELRGKLGALSNECSKLAILDIVCLAVKKYSMLLSDGVEIRKGKGIPKNVLTTTRHADFIQTHLGNLTSHSSFTQLRASQHSIYIIEQSRKTLNVLIDKSFQINRCYCRPMEHWKNSLLGIWLRLKCSDTLLEIILEYVRGVPPKANVAWGGLLRNLSDR
ncbi:unnamed protein product, partial [Symbiodinium sp. CCMP2592]